MRKPRRRKQNVQLRQRRREHLRVQVKGAFIKTAIAAVAVGAAFLLLTQGDSLFGRFIERHTPRLEVKAAQTLGEISIAAHLPKKLIWLWLPGGGMPLARGVTREFPAVKDVVFDKNFFDNRIVIRLVPRKPLVQAGTQAMDEEGILFPLTPGTWNQLPRAALGNFVPRAVLGRWLAALAKKSDLWGQVTGVADDRMGNVLFDLQSGARVQWGPPDMASVGAKAASLLQVLSDAHEHLGGAGLADLRFFDEGRIIVRPKGK